MDFWSIGSIRGCFCRGLREGGQRQRESPLICATGQVGAQHAAPLHENDSRIGIAAQASSSTNCSPWADLCEAITLSANSFGTMS